MSFKVVFSPKSYKKIKSFIETDHPEISGQLDKIEETLSKPDIIVRSRTDPDIELFIGITTSRLLPRSIYVL